MLHSIQRCFALAMVFGPLLLGTVACATSAPATTPTESEPAQGPPPKLSSDEIKQARLDAQVVAGTWLLQVDQGDYPGSWDNAASALQNLVGKGEWAQGLTKGRSTFGALERRHFLKTKYSNKLQPAGHHVVVNYHSQFANGPAKESVTVMKDADNQWRVLMYGINKTDTSPPEEAPTEPQEEGASDEEDAP